MICAYGNSDSYQKRELKRRNNIASEGCHLGKIHMVGKWKLNTQKADREFWIWLAGLFDGEGTILVSKYTRTRDEYLRVVPEVMISNTSKPVMMNIAETIDMPLSERKREDRKWIYELRIRKMENIVLFLEKIIPYLRIKRTQAELLYVYCKSRVERPWRSKYTNEELQLFNKIRELNAIHGRSRYEPFR
jgi:hypothetical protein